MTVQLTHGSAHDSLRAPVRILRWRSLQARWNACAAGCGAPPICARRESAAACALHLLDDRIYADLSQARRQLEFTYRNNLDLR